MNYESIKCTGYAVNGTDVDLNCDVLVRLSRSDIWELKRFLLFAAEQGNEYGFIRDCVAMCERWGGVLEEHSRLIDDASNDM